MQSNAMYFKRLLKAFLLFIILISAGLIFTNLLKNSDKSIVTIQTFERPALPLSFEGLKANNYKGSQLTFKIIADELKINPRKFYIL